jgi:putative spermidine/putrescine transport system permease protein
LSAVPHVLLGRRDGDATKMGWQLACLAPAISFFVAFWLLPIARLIMLPAGKGLRTYFVVITDASYFKSLFNTLLLSMTVTGVTLVLGASVGIFLARSRFAGRRILIALITLPLSFPGVIIGYFVILLGGRQGVIANLAELAGLGQFTFAYGLTGLFLAYLYFSLPRAVGSYAAAAAAMDRALEEAARSLGASRWHIVRDVWIPELAPVTLACGAIVFATAMGAFGTAFTLASKFEVLPITIYNEFTNYANFALAAALSITLGIVSWASLAVARRLGSASSLGL